MNDKEIQRLLDKEWNLDFPSMRISRNGESYTGNGFVQQKENGILYLKLYCNEKIGFRGIKTTDILSNSDVGELINRNEYFKFLGTDQSGNTWKSENLLAYKSIGSDGSLVITAKPYEISTEIKIGQKYEKSFGRFIYQYPYKFPFNSTTHTQTKFADKNFNGFNRDLGLFSIGAINIEIRKVDDQYLDIKLFGKSGSLDKNLDLRLTETLQFTLSQKLHWVFSEIKSGKKEEVFIRSFDQKEQKSNFLPPLPVRDLDFDGHFKQLFEKYFEYVSTYKEDRFYPISSHILSLIYAGQGSYESLGLELGVALEGIINAEFDFIDVPQSISEKEIEDIRQIINNSDLRDEIKGRYKGFTDNVNNIRAIDILCKLAEDGLIDKKLIKGWNKLRNPNAHPNRNKPFEVTKFKKRIDKTLSLFYQLIFLKIGYKGGFTDYSQKGWKLKIFDKEIQK